MILIDFFFFGRRGKVGWRGVGWILTSPCWGGGGGE